jgi:hypothetical protein
MASENSLLGSWPDEKAGPSLEDGRDGQQQKRVKARNPFSVVGYVILVLIAFGAIRMIHVRSNYILSGTGTKIDCQLHKEEMITNFKQVRAPFHS